MSAPRLTGSRSGRAPESARVFSASRPPRAELVADGAALRAWRIAAGLRLEDVAAELRVSVPTVCRYEKGVFRMSAPVLERLAQLQHPRPAQDRGARGMLAGLEPWVRVAVASQEAA